MSQPAACPIARAEAGLAAIFAACEANKARQAEARRARMAGLGQGRRFWWQDEKERDTFANYARDTRS